MKIIGYAVLLLLISCPLFASNPVLSPRQKEIIYYRFVEGLSYEEICQIMDMNYQSTQNLIQRSLKKLRTTFSQAEMQFVLLLLISM